MTKDEMRALSRVLIDYRQCDEDGILCATSRQAVEVASALIREMAEQPQAAPEGWRLVPVQPTDEMLTQAEENTPKFLHGDPWYGAEEISSEQAEACYKAMLAAAPQPPMQAKLIRLRIIPTHEAADAFWKRWREVRETGKNGYYESTWSAINAALAHGVRQDTQG